MARGRHCFVELVACIPLRPKLATAPRPPADRRLYEALCARDYQTWRAKSLAPFEEASPQEALNWFGLLGAMEKCTARLKWSEFVETNIFSSNQVFGVFAPA